MRIIQIAKNKSDQSWTGVDLDGTLAKYDGWKGVDHIGDPIPKMLSRVKRWLSNGKTVKIFTARVSGKDKEAATKAIKKWCKQHLGKELAVVCEKDHNMTELWDDRAVRVKKNKGERTAHKMADKFDASREALGVDVVDNFLASFGLGPKYVPKEPKRAGKCPKCGSNDTRFQEVHPDTDMNDIVLKCNSCGYSDD